MPFEAPPWLTMQYQRRSRIPELLLESGRIQAEGAARSGAIWGGAVRDLGGIAAQGVQQYSETKKAEKAAQLEKAQEAAFLDLLQKTEGNPSPMAVIRLYGPERGMKVAEGLRAFQALGEKKGEEALAFLPKLIGGLDAVSENVRAQLYPVARQKAIETGIFPPEAVPEQYDPKAWQEISKFGKSLTAKTGDPFTLSPGQQRFGPDGQPIASVEPEPPKPEGPRVVGRSLVGPDGKVMYRDPTEPSEATRPVAVLGDDQQPIYVRPGEAVGRRPAPSTQARETTEDERKTSGFYSQMQDAIKTIDEVEDQISSKELYQIQTLPQEGLIGMANRGELSEAGKRYLRAFEQFTEARLRPVSGAAIADTEYARDRRTYAKQYGETAGLAKDRKRAREIALDTLKTRAGRAYKAPDAGDSGVITTPDGKKWRKTGNQYVEVK